MSDTRLYHVTVLSNFVRGFDKYAHAYSKSGIPEATFPDRFFLLRADELAIGVRKASRLLEKLALPGNRLVALETRVSGDALRPNERTGLGQYIESPTIRLDGVYDLVAESGEWRMVPLAVEEAVALSLRLLQPEFVPFARLQPRTLSVLPIAQGCQAACPFCFSDASVSAVQEQARIDFDAVAAIAKQARARGAERFVITGGGEPGLVPHDRLTRLIKLGAQHLGKSVLITNGHHLGKLDEMRRRDVLADYHAVGLNVLAVSHHHYDSATNASLMKLHTPVIDLAATWHSGRNNWPHLRLRFTCVLQRGGIEDADGLEEYVTWAASLGVEEICFKELYVSTSIESVYHQYAANAWSRRHQVSLSLVLDFARRNGFREVSRLPWGAPVFRGEWHGRPMQVAAYTEPSLFWERTHAIARSWNLMADGRCLASLEDRSSEITLEAAA